MNYVLKTGHGCQIHDGSGQFGYVHVGDLADVYILLLGRILRGEDAVLPHGRAGLIFPCVGMLKWTDMAWGCVEAAVRRGLLRTKGSQQG